MTTAKKQASHVKQEPGPEDFSTLKEVLDYVTGTRGRKLSMSTLFKHSASKKLPDTDGFWTRKDVDAYASLLPIAVPQDMVKPKKNRRPPSDFDTLEDLGRIKLEREIEKMEAQTRSISFKNAVEEGKYFRKNDVWLELASRAAILYQGLQQDLLAAVPSIVQASRESEDRVEMVVRGAIERALDLAINQFSRPMTLDVETWDGTVEEEKDGDAGDHDASD